MDKQLDQLIDDISTRMYRIAPINGTVIFDLGDHAIYIDGRGHTPEITCSSTEVEADCRIRLAQELLASILAGERNGFMAFMSGQIAASGDMSVAVKLRGLLSGD